jgi:hypothetical protein
MKINFKSGLIVGGLLAFGLLLLCNGLGEIGGYLGY